MKRKLYLLALCFTMVFALYGCGDTKNSEDNVTLDFTKSQGVEGSALYDMIVQHKSAKTTSSYKITAQVKDDAFTSVMKVESQQEDVCTIQLYAPESADSKYIEKALVLHCEDNDESFDQYLLLDQDKVTVTSKQPE